MSREPARNLAASVRARLLTLAQEKGEDYQRILSKYAVERFLFRLGRSEHRDRFILKGAMLFTLFANITLDLLDHICYVIVHKA